ncbi:MAG: hypothetical protein ABFD64_14040 [Armatimonadota bacterium]
MSQCDYWWSAGAVEWCDLTGNSCRCSGCEDFCSLKKRRKKSDKTTDNFQQMISEMDDFHKEPRHNRMSH